MLTLTILKSGWGPWLNKQKISAYEALFLFGGKFLLWLVGCLGFEPRLAFWVKIQALRWGLHAWGWECGPCPVFTSNYALAFTLQLRKITVKPQSGQPKSAWQITAEHDSFGRFGHLLYPEWDVIGQVRRWWPSGWFQRDACSGSCWTIKNWYSRLPTQLLGGRICWFICRLMVEKYKNLTDVVRCGD